MIKTVNALEAQLEDVDEAMDVAVIGCVVNGPGEAREAAIGVAGGRPNSIYVDGSIQHKAGKDELAERLEALIREKIAARKKASTEAG